MNIAHSTHCTIIIPWFNMATWNFFRSTVGTSGWNDRMIDGPSHVRTQGRHLRDLSAVFGIASGSLSNIGPYYLRNWTFSRRYRVGHTHFTLFTANWDVLKYLRWFRGRHRAPILIFRSHFSIVLTSVHGWIQISIVTASLQVSAL